MKKPMKQEEAMKGSFRINYSLRCWYGNNLSKEVQNIRDERLLTTLSQCSDPDNNTYAGSKTTLHFCILREREFWAEGTGGKEIQYIDYMTLFLQQGW